MLTDAGLRDLLRAGYETSDADFVAHPLEKVSRAVYFMAGFLRESRYRSRHKYISSVDLQRQIDDQLRTSGNMPTDKRLNAVDWFSEQWTLAVDGKPTTPYFLDEYRELFDRQGENPTNYRIKMALYDSVERILSQLGASTHSGSSMPSNAPVPEAPNTSDRSTGETMLPSVNGPGATDPDLSGLAEQLESKGSSTRPVSKTLAPGLSEP